MSAELQEVLALGIVGLTLAVLGWRGFQAYLAAPLAKWLLRTGRVNWALRVKKYANTSKCCD